LIPGSVLTNINKTDINNEWLYPASGFGDLWWGFLYKHFNLKLEYYENIFCNIYTPEAEQVLRHRDLSEIITVHPVRTKEQMSYYTKRFNKSVVDLA